MQSSTSESICRQFESGRQLTSEAVIQIAGKIKPRRAGVGHERPWEPAGTRHKIPESNLTELWALRPNGSPPLYERRVEGCTHQAALRSLAFKWIRILYRCWEVLER